MNPAINRIAGGPSGSTAWQPNRRKKNQPSIATAQFGDPLMNRIPIESLESRTYFAVTAVFVPFAGLLNVTGDSAANTIVVSRDAAGTILVNGGAVHVIGGTPTVANTRLISVFGLDGNDNLSLSEVNGALPAADLFGGSGNDVLT